VLGPGLQHRASRLVHAALQQAVASANQRAGQDLLSVGKARGNFIDIRDIADMLVRLLNSDDLNSRDFDITGA
jgi:nucleoside-diphosphate-sugar epimerase